MPPKEAIDTLERLGLQAVPLTGHSTVVTIVSYLRMGQLTEAQAVYQNDGDKLWSYPAIRTQVISMLGCRLHLKHGCKGWLCKNP